MKTYALGLDYGTNSCRSVVVDLADGTEVADHVFHYPSGELGILTDPQDPNVARQNPQDYLDGLDCIIREALAKAAAADGDFAPERIIGIGVDTTGSTPLPVDEQGVPLAFDPRFQTNPAAMAWLWKDHTSHAEAEEITTLARELHPEYLAKCGGTYSSEWFWAKLLHCRRTAPEVFAAAFSFVECCDFIPAVLAGNTDPLTLARSVCAAGHKAMFNADWGGLPERDFLARLDPALAELRDRLFTTAQTADQRAGSLCPEWAGKLGLTPGIAIATGAFDAHMGAVGSGIKPGTLVKILGTSTCDLLVCPNDRPLQDIPGVCGIVNGSVLPDCFGIEAGQSAVGDIFLWLVHHIVPARYGQTPGEMFAEMERLAGAQEPGAHGLLALDWNNGNRTILVDVRLTGLLLGQTLHTEAHEIYRALVEATAFGALTIINRIEEYGVAVEEVVNCGGLAVKSPFLMQIYADVTGRPMKVARSTQTCALGAAIFAAVAAGRAAGGFDSVGEAQQAVTGVRDTVYMPDPGRHEIYTRLYRLYRTVHDAFGTAEWSGQLNHVMKELITLREAQR